MPMTFGNAGWTGHSLKERPEAATGSDPDDYHRESSSPEPSSTFVTLVVDRGAEVADSTDDSRLIAVPRILPANVGGRRYVTLAGSSSGCPLYLET